MLMVPRVWVGRIAFHALTQSEAVEAVLSLAEQKPRSYVVTPNADHVVRSEKMPDYQTICAKADLVLPDGMPIVWASRWLGVPLPMRVTGSDLAPEVCRRALRRGLSVFLLGGMPGEARRAAASLAPCAAEGAQIGEFCPPMGFHKDAAACERIVERINEIKPAVILVGLGSPKQEEWIDRWRMSLDCGVLMGVGATIGFMAGTQRRAPRWMQVSGIEWLYRLLQEPRRLAGRYFRDLEIIGIVWRQRQQQRSKEI